ncbi:MAG: hypothetical protein AAF745_05880 [Planctomycetota bacterium]
MIVRRLVSIVLLLLYACSLSAASAKDKALNVISIFENDLGYSDRVIVGCDIMLMLRYRSISSTCDDGVLLCVIPNRPWVDTGDGGCTQLLFDLEADYGEQHDVANQHPKHLR